MQPGREGPGALTSQFTAWLPPLLLQKNLSFIDSGGTSFANRTQERVTQYICLNLFRAYCVRFYDIAPWRNCHSYAVSKLSSAYVKRLKIFFDFPKYSSVTAMIMQLGVPSFDTLIHNAKVGLGSRLRGCSNALADIVLRFADVPVV